jgi:hypothetical protein
MAFRKFRKWNKRENKKQKQIIMRCPKDEYDIECPAYCIADPRCNHLSGTRCNYGKGVNNESKAGIVSEELGF